ncbi:hypothetical protein ACJX0J_038318, partial [Zea mays]
ENFDILFCILKFSFLFELEILYSGRVDNKVYLFFVTFVHDHHLGQKENKKLHQYFLHFLSIWRTHSLCVRNFILSALCYITELLRQIYMWLKFSNNNEYMTKNI